MKKIICFILCFCLLAGLSVTLAYESDYGTELAGTTLNVYNWGEYIDESQLTDFEELTGININYSTFETNESMYTKLIGGGANYDIIIPSDYMVARLIREDRLEKLDRDHIPNLRYLDLSLDTSYDPTGEYSVPYTWSFVGMVYNSDYIHDEITGFSALWDEKYTGKILMMNNSRDVFAVALSRLGYGYNSENIDEWNEALDLLSLQKPLLQGYITDEIFNKMESGEAWISPCYIGDYLEMVENNEALRMVYPEEGSNTFVDALCIPKGAKNKAAAELFINFLYEPEVSLQNMNELYYFTPNTATAEMDEYFVNSDLDDETMIETMEAGLPQTMGQVFGALSPETQKVLEDNWLSLKKSSVGLYVYIILGAALVFAVVTAIVQKIRKKKAEALYESDYGRN